MQQNETLQYTKVQKPRLRMIGYRMLLTKLLHGQYSSIARRETNRRKSIWCIYEGNMNPVQYISRPTFRAAEKFLKKEGDLFVLDLEKIKHYHGNFWLKKLYNKQVKTSKDGEA